MDERVTVMMAVCIFATLFFCIGFAIGIKSAGEGYYKQGQVDCINKKIVYELKTNENNEKIWRKIEGSD